MFLLWRNPQWWEWCRAYGFGNRMWAVTSVRRVWDGCQVGVKVEKGGAFVVRAKFPPVVDTEEGTVSTLCAVLPIQTTHES